MLKLEDIQAVYFAGVGGIGMSALARFFNSKNVQVRGYDRARTQLTNQLQHEGIEIEYSFEQLPELKNFNCIIYTPALKEDHPLIEHCRAANKPMLKRAEMLGIISRAYTTLAVAGTHGKTSTTSLLTHILRVGGIDVTAFLGGISADLNSNFVAGKSEYIVVEADEFDRSFMHLEPTHAAIMNSDADHLDIYGSHSAMLETFLDFSNLIPKNGSLTVADNVDDSIKRRADSIIGNDADFEILNLRAEEGKTCYTLNTPKGKLDLRTSFHGAHNAMNAAAAISIAQQVGISNKSIVQAVESFKGISRRFELRYSSEHCTLIDDYAHHPTEIQAAYQAARQVFPNKNIAAIFQPHLFSRTQDFLDEFAASLSQFDLAYLIDIYPARELPIEGVTSDKICHKMTNDIRGVFSLQDIVGRLNFRDADVWMILGAGDIYTIIPDCIQKINRVFNRNK